MIATDLLSATSIGELATSDSFPHRFDTIAPTISFQPQRADPWMWARVDERADLMLSLVAESTLVSRLSPGTLAG